ncbi:hypothetical protein D3C80_1872890 [compost metagenome]
MSADKPCHDAGHQRRDNERRECHDGIGADDEFYGIECPGQRRVEGSGNGTSSTTADEDAHVSSSQLQLDTDLGGHTAGDLRIACLKPDRCAETV